MIDNDRLAVFRDLCEEHGMLDIYNQLHDVHVILKTDSLGQSIEYFGFAYSMKEAKEICENDTCNEHWIYNIYNNAGDVKRYVTTARLKMFRDEIRFQPTITFQ